MLFHQEKVGLPLAAAAAVAQTLRAEQQLQGNDPFSQRDGWRSHGRTQRRFAFTFGDAPVSAELTYLDGVALHFSVQPEVGESTSGALVFEALADDRVALQFAGERAVVSDQHTGSR